MIDKFGVTFRNNCSGKAKNEATENVGQTYNNEPSRS